MLINLIDNLTYKIITLRNKIIINKTHNRARNVAHGIRGAYNGANIDKVTLTIEVLINRTIHHLSKRKGSIEEIIISIINAVN